MMKIIFMWLISIASTISMFIYDVAWLPSAVGLFTGITVIKTLEFLNKR